MMKKILFFGVATLVVVAMSSCRKNRTCQCSDVDGGSYTFTILLQKKKEAQATCDSFEDSYYTSCDLN